MKRLDLGGHNFVTNCHTDLIYSSLESQLNSVQVCNMLFVCAGDNYA